MTDIGSNGEDGIKTVNHNAKDVKDEKDLFSTLGSGAAGRSSAHKVGRKDEQDPASKLVVPRRAYRPRVRGGISEIELRTQLLQERKKELLHNKRVKFKAACKEAAEIIATALLQAVDERSLSTFFQTVSLARTGEEARIRLLEKYIKPARRKWMSEAGLRLRNVTTDGMEPK